MKVDVRKIGIWMVGVGGVAMSVGLVADAVRHADDPTLASREGIFDLSGFPHALFFGGICVARPRPARDAVRQRALPSPASSVTVGRRLAQVGAPIAAVVLDRRMRGRREQLDARRRRTATRRRHDAAAGHDAHGDGAATDGPRRRAVTRTTDRRRATGATAHRRDARHAARRRDRRDRDRRLAVRDRVADAGVARPGRHR